jgi:hypothetical protein
VAVQGSSERMANSRSPWRRLGRLPAVAVVGAFFLMALLTALVLDDTAQDVAGSGLVVALITYCIARPHSGLDVFCFAAAPAATGTILHDIAGTPRWIGLLLIPLSLLMVWEADRTGPAEPRIRTVRGPTRS